MFCNNGESPTSDTNHSALDRRANWGEMQSESILEPLVEQAAAVFQREVVCFTFFRVFSVFSETYEGGSRKRCTLQAFHLILPRSTYFIPELWQGHRYQQGTWSLELGVRAGSTPGVATSPYLEPVPNRHDINGTTSEQEHMLRQRTCCDNARARTVNGRPQVKLLKERNGWVSQAHLALSKPPPKLACNWAYKLTRRCQAEHRPIWEGKH